MDYIDALGRKILTVMVNVKCYGNLDVGHKHKVVTKGEYTLVTYISQTRESY